MPKKRTKSIADKKAALKTSRTWLTEAKTDADYESKAAKRYRKARKPAQAKVASQEANRAKQFVGIRKHDVAKQKSQLNKLLKKAKRK